VSDITTGLKRCFDKIDEYDERTKELTRLIKNAQAQCKEEYL
jgi:ppGpp synthetase/RelA/SpoT-type nucleotidyltranferase